MNNKQIKIIILCVSIALAVFFRLYELSSVPPSLSLDEVSIGYNAYSLLKTGKDEFGSAFPVLLRAYDDYRPALYVYLVMGFLPFFGLSALSVRLPAIVLSFSILGMSFVIATLLAKDKKLPEKIRMWLPYAVVFGVAISPWHIYLSRLGHEANLGLFMSTGLVLSCFWYTKSKKYSHIALLCIGLFTAGSLWSYQSQKVITPLFLGMFGLLYRKELWKDKTFVVLAVLVSACIAFPAIKASLTPEGLSRLRGTSAFSKDQAIYYDAFKQMQEARKNGDYIGMGWNHRRMMDVRIFVTQYVSHFRPNWLFVGGDRESHKIPGMGLLYIWELPFIVVGMWILTRSASEKKLSVLLLSWMFIAPLPGALTTQAPHAMRAYQLVPVIQIYAALGIVWTLFLFSKKQRYIYSIMGILLVVISLHKMYKGYFVRFPVEQSDAFQYALHDVLQFIKQENLQKISIQFSNENALYQSYMFFLFDTTYDPVQYASYGGTISGGYAQTHTFDRYTFAPFTRQTIPQKGMVYVTNHNDFPSGGEVLYTAKQNNGIDAIDVVRY